MRISVTNGEYAISVQEGQYIDEDVLFKLMGYHCSVHDDTIARSIKLIKVDSNTGGIGTASIIRDGKTHLILQTLEGPRIRLDFSELTHRFVLEGLQRDLGLYYVSGAFQFGTLNRFLNYLANGGVKSLTTWIRLVEIIEEDIEYGIGLEILD